MQSPGEWERICRAQAAMTNDSEVRRLLLELAGEYRDLAFREARASTSPLDGERSDRFDWEASLPSGKKPEAE
jgi:hypothetical protein